MSDARPPAGWYPDAQQPGFVRYWDGAAWTDHSQPAGAVVPPSADDDGAIRADIDEAKRRMSTKFGGRRELRKLPGHLWEGERVDRMATGLYAGKNGLLVLTDRRLLFMAEGLVSSKIEDFPNEKISSVQSSSGMVFGTLTIFASGNKAEIKNVTKADLKPIADALRARISAPVPATPRDAPAAADASVPQPVDHVAQLRQLAGLRDSGILTDAEFEAKKAEILGRM